MKLSLSDIQACHRIGMKLSLSDIQACHSIGMKLSLSDIQACHSIGMKLSLSDIQVCHRIGKQKIRIVKFTNRKFARAGLVCGKNLKGKKLYDVDNKTFTLTHLSVPSINILIISSENSKPIGKKWNKFHSIERE